MQNIFDGDDDGDDHDLAAFNYVDETTFGARKGTFHSNCPFSPNYRYEDILISLLPRSTPSRIYIVFI